MVKFLGFLFFIIIAIGSTGCSAPTPSATLTPTLPSPTRTLTATRTITSTPTRTPTLTRVSTYTRTTTLTSTKHPLANVPFRILFVSDDDGDADIYSINADGTNLQNLTHNNLDDSYPAASPDGTKIAYSMMVYGYPNIFIMDNNGDNPTQITNDQSRNEMSNWSPDGTKLAFSSDRTGYMEVYVMNKDGSNLTQVTYNNEIDIFPIWSPDGNWISYSSSISGNADIFIIHPDGSGKKQITRSPNYDGDAARWSPDGQWMIIPSNRTGNYELYAHNTKNNKFGAITYSEEQDWRAEYSPDGLYLLREIYDWRNQNFITVSPASDLTTIYHPLPQELNGVFSTWLPVGSGEAKEPSISFVNLLEGFCVFETDPTFGYTLDNPIRSAYASSILRGPNGELVTINPGSSDLDVVNSNGDIVSVYQYTIKGIRTGTLYINTKKHTIPRIPLGFSCDLLWP
jgi:hypothetical protein